MAEAGVPWEPWPEGGFPQFSDAEREARREKLAALMAESRVDRLVVYGTWGSGDAVHWVSNWPVSREAAAVWAPGETVKLFVQYRNHVPTARRAVASEVEVAWGGPWTAEAVGGELLRRGGHSQRVGIVGPLPGPAWNHLAAQVREVVDLTAGYTQLRLVKSPAEVAWLRRGAALTDQAVRALEANLRPGVSEFELVDAVQRAYVPLGGMTHIHYLSVTSPSAPDRCAPSQFPSPRRVRPGDVVTCELSASYWGYPGQILRTFVVAADPPPEVRELHRVAEEAFGAALRSLQPGLRAEGLGQALEVVRDSGFALCDDLVHGFGGGYLPPILGAEGFWTPAHASLELQPGMALVVQPNVVTPDGQFGVQTGELVVLGSGGPEFVHQYPRGLRLVG